MTGHAPWPAAPSQAIPCFVCLQELSVFHLNDRICTHRHCRPRGHSHQLPLIGWQRIGVTQGVLLFPSMPYRLGVLHTIDTTGPAWDSSKSTQAVLGRSTATWPDPPMRELGDHDQSPNAPASLLPTVHGNRNQQEMPGLHYCHPIITHATHCSPPQVWVRTRQPSN